MNATICLWSSSFVNVAIDCDPARRRASGLARDDEAFVVEPKTLVLLQDLRGGLEIVAGPDHGIETLVLDLAHVDRSVPRGEQRRRADALLDLARQRVHFVAEDRLRVGPRDEIEVPR